MSTNARKSMPADARECSDNGGGAETIQTPSLITPLHRLDRETSTTAGAPRAWRKVSQLQHAYDLDRLGARDSGEARDRLEAGRIFTELWDTAQAAGKDSTQQMDGGGGGTGIPLSERQRAAIQRLVQIEMHLGQRDRTIIRAVCAYGHSPKEAMAQAKLCKDVRVSSRFCEALDALVDAVERTERRARK